MSLKEDIILSLEYNQSCDYNKSEKKKLSVSSKCSKATLMYDLDKNFIKEFKSATEAAKELNGSVTGIALASRTNSKYKNWIFKYKKYEETK